MEVMQFDHAFDHILREIILVDPSLGPVKLMEVDICDGFYRVNLNIDDIPKLGVVFPTMPGRDSLIAFPLGLSMGWKNSPPIVSTATKTIADLANQRILVQTLPILYPLCERAKLVVLENPLQPTFPAPLVSANYPHHSSAQDITTPAPQEIAYWEEGTSRWYNRPYPP